MATLPRPPSPVSEDEPVIGMTMVQAARESIADSLPPALPPAIHVDEMLGARVLSVLLTSVSAYLSHTQVNTFFLRVHSGSGTAVGEVFGAVHLSRFGFAVCATVPSEVWSPSINEASQVFTESISSAEEATHLFARMLDIFMHRDPSNLHPMYDASAPAPPLELDVRPLPTPRCGPGRVGFGGRYPGILKRLLQDGPPSA